MPTTDDDQALIKKIARLARTTEQAARDFVAAARAEQVDQAPSPPPRTFSPDSKRFTLAWR